MAVPTFRPQKNIPFASIIVYALAVVGVGLLVYFGGDFVRNIAGLSGKSALFVSLLNGDGEVFVDEAKAGVTPYDSKDIKSGEHKVALKSSDRTYEVKLNFLPNTQVVINRDLGISETFSSGQNFWIEKGDSGTVLSAISDPSGASVFVDNTEIGKTPFSSNNLSDGDYDLRVEKVGFESQSARIKIQKGYKLNVSIKIFPVPISSKVELLEDSQNLYLVSSDNSFVSSDTQAWVKALLYWNQTRGINLAGSGVNKERVFDFFLDYSGKLYNSEGKIVGDPASDKSLGEAKKGAYLNKSSSQNVLSEEAKKTFALLSLVVGGKKAKIKETGTGWLRVRSSPGLDGAEVAKVNVGDEFTVLEEKPGWTKIKISGEVEGWVSSTYVEVS